MTTITETADIDQEALREWCEEVARVYHAIAVPFVENDPRAAARYLRAHGTPEDLGEDYAEQHLDRLVPRPPLPIQPWVESVEVEVCTYPEIGVTFYGEQHGQGRTSARVVSTHTIFVEDFIPRPGGPVSDRAGTYILRDPSVETASDELTFEDAMNISTALEDACLAYSKAMRTPAPETTAELTEEDLDAVVHLGPLRKTMRYLTAEDCTQLGHDDLAKILDDYPNFEAALRAGALNQKLVSK